MKVLCRYSGGGSVPVRTGWGRVFAALGHQFSFWNSEGKSAFDVFSEYEPDLYLGTTYDDIDRAVIKNIRKRPNMKVALYASAWGPRADALDPKEYPIVRVSQQEIDILGKLKEETGKPDFVFLHVADHNLEDVLGGWRLIGITPIGVLNAADTFAYAGGIQREHLRSDVSLVGGYWPFKARNIDRFLLPLCHSSKNLNVKIWGNGQWPVTQFLGYCQDETMKDIFASARVCPNVSEPHSTSPLYRSDIVERPFKAALSGLVVSDYVEEAEVVFKGVLEMAKTPEEYEQKIRYWINSNEEERNEYKARLRKVVLDEHTYFHRIRKILKNLGMSEEASRCLSFYKSIKPQLESICAGNPQANSRTSF
jgi:hypothetical protein